MLVSSAVSFFASAQQLAGEALTHCGRQLLGLQGPVSDCMLSYYTAHANWMVFALLLLPAGPFLLQLGGVLAPNGAGEDVIIGIIDTGCVCLTQQAVVVSDTCQQQKQQQR